MSETESPELDAIEARVLGCLIEKQATTPDNYPLTLNALVVACNQKTSRSPVMNLEPGKVGQTLRQLEQRRLVEREHGARAERWAHRVDQQMSLTAAQRILLGLLMLRGAQTANELLTRSERMHDFDDLDELKYQLERLAQHDRVRLLDRLPGQREQRYVQLLTGEPDLSAIAQPPARAVAPADELLIQRIEALEARVEALEAALSGERD